MQRKPVSENGRPVRRAEAPIPSEVLQPIEARQTVQNRVYDSLREALIIGRFDPGQRLTIDALAATFGISHMPVREALRRLTAEGALEHALNGSSLVPSVSRERLEDLCRVRIALEGPATELAAANVRPLDLQKLETILHQHETARLEDGVHVILAHNRAFHFLIYRVSGSELLPALIEVLWLRFGPYMSMLSRHLEPAFHTRAFRNGTKHHHHILAALRTGDAAAARAAIETDIRATQQLLLGLTEVATPARDAVARRSR